MSDKEKLTLQSSLDSKTESVYLRISTNGLKRKKMLMRDLQMNLDKLAAMKTELYGEILISGDPIEFDED